MASSTAYAELDWECYLNNGCRSSSGRSSGNPSKGGQIKINPAAVPTEKGFGIEGIYFSPEIDVSLVRGLGRVGAAISPSNSEETFFGPPAFEDATAYLNRRLDLKKYPNQKYTLAAAGKVIDRYGSGDSRLDLSLGVMGKYNKFTTNVSPGLGMNGTLGPISFGGSYYFDETQMQSELEKSLRPPPILYHVQNYNVGVYLSSLILDYSRMRLQRQHEEYYSEITLVTASLLYKGFIFTASKRHENSDRPAFNYETQSLETTSVKEDFFGGVQYSVTKNLMLGVLYNYYLLHEGSVTATFFF